MRRKKKGGNSSNEIRCTVYIIVYSLLSVGKESIIIYLELFTYKVCGLIDFTTRSVSDAMYIQTTFPEYSLPFKKVLKIAHLPSGM